VTFARQHSGFWDVMRFTGILVTEGRRRWTNSSENSRDSISRVISPNGCQDISLKNPKCQSHDGAIEKRQMVANATGVKKVIHCLQKEKSEVKISLLIYIHFTYSFGKISNNEKRWCVLVLQCIVKVNQLYGVVLDSGFQLRMNSTLFIFQLNILNWTFCHNLHHFLYNFIISSIRKHSFILKVKKSLLEGTSDPAKQLLCAAR